jgi:predicted permease
MPDCEPAVRTIIERVRSLPGVENAAISSGGPLTGGMDWRSGIRFEDSPGEQPFNGMERSATPGFFQTAGMRILRGRDFVAADFGSVAVVSTQFAREYFQGRPLGKRFSTHKDQSGRPVWLDIIGEVNDTRNRAVTQFSSGAIYYTSHNLRSSRWQLLARTSGDPASLTKPLVGVVRSMDKSAVITNVQTLEKTLADSAALPKFQASIFGGFGLLALLLAMIGIFGVTSYSVQQRTHEIGIRMSLGARASQVMGRIIAQGAAVALTGIACGILAALVLVRFVESMLFGVHAVDTATYAGVSGLLLAAALLSFYLPARSAARIDPIQALRHD